MMVENGRPADLTGRPEKEKQCYDWLDGSQIPFHRVDHEPADTMEACRAIEAALGCPVCKNLFLCNRQETQFYLLMLPGDKPFKTKYLSAQLGVSRLSFANASHMEELLNLTPGSVTVFGLGFDTAKRVQLVVDKDVLDLPFVGCHPCINTSTVKVSVTDVLERFVPFTGHTCTVVDLPRTAE